LLGPGGAKSVMAETLLTKQQLIIMNRGKNRAPKLTTFDRFYFGFVAFFIGENRLQKVAVVLKPATILRFHKALWKRKYSKLYSNKTKRKLGRKGPDQALVDLVIEIKSKNPSMGYLRISMQIYEAFGICITPFAVGRILRKHYKNGHPGKGNGPSWLTFIGHMKDSLWSVDLFKCESILLTTYTVMVVMDQYTRRIIGFAVHRGDCDGIAYCRMFNAIISGKTLPKYLSTDNDPLYLYHRWIANLDILEIEEIKSVPRIPVSHPFVERLIKSVRTECLDHQLFFNKLDLERKLENFQRYFNETRAHSSLEKKTPRAMASESNIDKKVVALDHYRWKSHCRGLYRLPVAA
jgi:transposase InsO family protein